MKIEIITTIICTTIVLLGGIAGSTYYHLNKTKMVTDTIQQATQKGVDPMAVRCSLSESTHDQICVVYAATARK